MSYENPPSDNLYMKGLPAGTTDETLKAIFGVYGTVVSCRVLPTPAGVSDTAALVRMSNVTEAQYLVENASNIASGLGSPVQIRFANNKGSGKGKGESHYQALPAPNAQQWSYGKDGAEDHSNSRGSVPSDNLYIRGFQQGATEDSIKAIFGVYGTVTSVRVLPAPAGKTDIACLVRMSSVEEATWLVDNLNGNIPQGLSDPISVRFADHAKGSGKGKGDGKSDGWNNHGSWAPTPSPAAAHFTGWGPTPGGKGEGAGAAGGADAPPSTNLYMKGLPGDTTEASIRTIFGAYGTVVSVKVLSCPPGVNSAAALVQMGTLSEAEWLVNNVNGNMPEGLSSPIQVKFANNNKGAGKGAGGGGGGWGAAPGGGGWGAAPGGAGAAAAPPPVVAAQVPGKGAAAGWGGGGGVAPSDNLYMKGFPSEVDEAMLRAILGPYGNIVSIKVLPPPPGKACAAALVRMSTVDEAKWLVENLNGNIPEGQTQPVEVRYAANAGGKGGGKDGGKDGWGKGAKGGGVGADQWWDDGSSSKGASKGWGPVQRWGPY